MHLVKVGNTVINLEHLVSISKEVDGERADMIRVETVNGVLYYSQDSDYDKLHSFLSCNLVSTKYSTSSGISVVVVESEPKAEVKTVEYAPGKVLKFE